MSWLGGIIPPKSLYSVNYDFDKKGFLDCRFYDRNGQLIKKNQKKLEIFLDDDTQKNRLGILSIALSQCVTSMWSLEKCKECNVNRLQKESCPSCIKAYKKFNNKKNITLDLNFFREDDQTRVAYRINVGNYL